MLDVLAVALTLSSLVPAQGDEIRRDPPAIEVVDAYIERYLETFPSSALAAGRFDYASQLENVDWEAWAAYNHETSESLSRLLVDPRLTSDERLDVGLLLRHTRLTAHDHGEHGDFRHDPLMWSGLTATAHVYLLVRDDHPLPDRLEAARNRALALPQLTAQAETLLGSGDLDRIVAEHAQLAARQVRGAATFYRDGFARAATDETADLAPALEAAGTRAAEALDRFASFLDDLATRATGHPALGAERYARRFQLVTGLDTPVDVVLRDAERDLAAKRAEAAAYGRGVWRQVFADTEPPTDDRAVLRALFDRLESDHAASTDDFVVHYRNLVDEAIDFARQRDMVPIPETLGVTTARSPAFLAGQSVGGVYPAGPYNPNADTLYFVPAPADDASPEAKETFFRAFNDHFNIMITPHEIIPGHVLQLNLTARMGRPVRWLFGDGVYVEGWGTFAERHFLDLGWGEPLDRLAHYKKQLENIARLIADIRVHTRGMDRDTLLEFLREDALQDPQFAANMWIRATTTSPQITTYHLGWSRFRQLYDDIRTARGEAFDLNTFAREILALGSVPIAAAREHLLGERRIDSAIQPPSADQVLSRSIAFHDPDGHWPTADLRMVLAEIRPRGQDRHTVIELGPDRFVLDTDRGEHRARGVLTTDACDWTLDGSSEISAEDRESMRLTCDRLKWMRNYYRYVWGLPMTLRDPGTVIDPEVGIETFGGRPVWTLRTTYPQPLPDQPDRIETWIFYIDRLDYQLVGCRFFREGPTTDGEVLTFADLADADGLRLHKTHEWYYNHNHQYLGGDTITEIVRLPR